MNLSLLSPVSVSRDSEAHFSDKLWRLMLLEACGKPQGFISFSGEGLLKIVDFDFGGGSAKDGFLENASKCFELLL